MDLSSGVLPALGSLWLLSASAPSLPRGREEVGKAWAPAPQQPPHKHPPQILPGPHSSSLQPGVWEKPQARKAWLVLRPYSLQTTTSKGLDCRPRVKAERKLLNQGPSASSPGSRQQQPHLPE